MTAEPAPAPRPYATAAWTYRDAGWAGVLPVPARAKGPVPSGYTGNAGVDPSGPDIQAWVDSPHGDGNIALRLPGDVLGVDVDQYGNKVGGAHLYRLGLELGPLPPTWRATSRDDGISGIRLYRVPPGLRWPGILADGIETIRHGHRYAVVWPSIHPEGRMYRWINPDGVTALHVPQAHNLPPLPQRWVDEFTHRENATDQARAGLPGPAVATWLDQHTDTQPCRHMTAALQQGIADLELARTGGSARHDAALALTNRLVWLAGEGHPGLADTLHAARAAFQAAVAGDRQPHEADAEWARMVDGAVQLSAAAHPTPNPDPCDTLGGLITPGETPWQQNSPATRSTPPSSSRSEPPSPSNGSQNGTAAAAAAGTSVSLTPTLPNGAPLPTLNHITPAGPAAAPGPSKSTPSTPGSSDPNPAPTATAPAEPAEQYRTTWWPRNIENAITGDNPEPPPAFLARADGHCAFYAGRVNGIIGPSESGKTWVALHACAQAIRAGRHVTFIDFEDSERGVIGRLTALGLTSGEIRDGFAYINPDEPYSRLTQTGTDLTEHFQQWQPALVILDGYNAAITAQGLDLNSNKDVTTFTRIVLRPLAANNQCAVYIDHVAKSKDNTSAGGIGAQAKRADTSGTCLRVDPIKTFGKGRAGRLRLLVDKDRQGDVRGISAPSVGGSDWYGDLLITSRDDGAAVTAELTVPDGLDVAAKTYEFRPTMLMGRISDWLGDNPGAGRNEILSNVTGHKKHLPAALKLLVDEGYVTVEAQGQKRLHTLLKPYSATLDGLISEPGSNRGPTGVQDPGQETGVPGVQEALRSSDSPRTPVDASEAPSRKTTLDPSQGPNPTGYRDGHLTDLHTGEILE